MSQNLDENFLPWFYLWNYCLKTYPSSHDLIWCTFSQSTFQAAWPLQIIAKGTGLWNHSPKYQKRSLTAAVIILSFWYSLWRSNTPVNKLARVPQEYLTSCSANNTATSTLAYLHWNVHEYLYRVIIKIINCMEGPNWNSH